MNRKFKKNNLCLILFVLAFILFFPKNSLAQEEVTLDQSQSKCINSVARVNLLWSSSIAGSPEFTVMRKMEGEEGYTYIYNTTSLTYIDVPVWSDKDYLYQIRAERGLDIFFSNTSSALAAYCPPTFPDAPTTTCESDGPRIIVGWRPVSGNLSTYNVWRATTSKNFTLLTSTAETSIDDGPDIIGTETYFYLVQAIWSDGNSSTSDDISQIAPTCPPTLSVGANCETAVAPGGPQVNLSWNGLLGVENYQIHRKAPGESEWPSEPLETLAETSYTDKLVESLSAYGQGGAIDYYVKAYWDPEEENSSVEQVNIPRCPPFLTIEDDCREFSFRLSWTATLGATRYNIWRATSTQTSDYILLFQTLDGNQTSYVDGLDESNCSGKICDFTYKIEAVVGVDILSSNEVFEDIDCATIYPPSPPPSLKVPKTECQGEPLGSVISNSWSKSENVYFYRLHRKETVSGNEIPVYEGPNISRDDKGVESNYEYTYRVTAVGQGGTTTESDNNVTITAASCLSPFPTSTLTLTAGCATGIPYVDLSWTETSNTYSYSIYRGTTTDNLILKMTFEDPAPEFFSRSWRDASVSTSTTYYYKVRSNGPTGVPPTDSLVKPKTTSSCFPTTPTLILSNSCNGQDPVVTLTWSTDGVNTHHYDIYRKDYSETETFHQIFTTSVWTWDDTSVFPEVDYEYKVVAVGHLGQRTTNDYKPITSWCCKTPGDFTLDDPPTIYCQGSYPWADLSWENSADAIYYDLNRYLYDNGSIIGTTTLSDVTSPFTDKGYGNALSFDGYNDRVSVGSSDSLKSTNQISIEAWIYPEPCSSYYCTYGAIVGRINGYVYSRIYLNKNNSQLVSYIYGTSYSSRYLAGPEIKFNNWNHIVYVYDGTHQYWYLDGNQETSSSRSDTLYAGSYGPRIGDGYYSYSQFKGKIDEVRIYGRALSPTEVAERFNGTYNDESDLRGLWHFDEGSGAGVSDSSNYGNNGTISGASWTKHGPQCEEKYSWQAVAYSMGSEGAFSNITTPTTTPLCPPAKPGLVLDATCEPGTSSVKLAWSFSIHATSYNIHRADSGLIKTILETDPEFSTRIWTDDNGSLGLIPSTVYTYWVEAVGSTGLTNESDYLDIVAIDCTPPDPPGDLWLTFACSGSYPEIHLDWPDATNADYYEIFKNSSSIATTTATFAVDTWPSVAVNTEYSYFIRTHNPGGYADSGTKPITTGYCPVSKPSVGLSTDCDWGSSPGNCINKISWVDGTVFNSEYYLVYRNTEDNFSTASLLITLASTTPEFSSRTWEDSDPGLLSDTTYYYWVKTIGYVEPPNISDSASILTYKCGIVPGSPTLSEVTAGCCRGISCSTSTWTGDEVNTVSYNVYRVVGSDTSVFSTRISPFSDRGSYALEFDSYGDYVYVSSANLKSTNEFSIEAWIYPTSPGYYRGIFGYINGYSSNYIRISSSNSLYARLYFSGSGCPYYSYLYGPSVTANTWNHIVFVFDGEYMKWYLNGGAPSTKYVGQNCYTRSSGSSMRIGAYHSSSYYFRGIIDDVRFYGRTLRSDEVQDHYQGIYNNENKLKGAWHFDEGSGLKAYDSSGNTGVDGNLQNENWVSLSSGDPTYIESLEGGQSYTYSVKAFGISTESGFSNEISIVAPPCGPVVNSFSATAQCSAGDSQIRLDWETINTSYCSVWKKREAEEFFTWIPKVFDPEDFYIDGDIASGETYEYYIEAFPEEGEPILSSVESATAPVCTDPPQTPVITVTPKCLGYSPRILIEWSEDPDGNTLSYNIWKKNEDCPGPQELTTTAVGLSPDTVQYFDSDIGEGETYCYKVEARGSGGDNFAFSDPVASTSLLCGSMPPPRPVLSLNFVHLEVGNCQVSLGWTDVGLDSTEPDNYYEILRSIDGGTNYSPIASTSGDVFAHVDKPVNEDTDYYYEVKACNKNGYAISDPILAEVGIAPPGNFTLTGDWVDAETRVHLTWTEAITGAGGPVSYEAWRNDTEDFETTVVCTGITAPPLECYDGSPTPAEPFYMIVATNTGGTATSNIVSMYDPPSMRWKEVIPQ